MGAQFQNVPVDVSKISSYERDPVAKAYGLDAFKFDLNDFKPE